MQWIGERFFNAHGAWIDAATGRPVRLHVSASGEGHDLDWDEQCARLANLRHPLLHSLLDYGAAAAGTRFEAYAHGGATATPGGSAEAALEHVAQFVRAAGVPMPPSRSACAMRAVTAARDGCARLVGLTLQGRPALEAVEEALDAMAPAGPALVHVTGAEGAGLQTLRMLTARSARIRGFIPVSPSAIARFPSILDAVRDRHACILDDGEDPARSAAGVARLIAALADHSARRHVVVRFHRQPCRVAGGIELEPLPLRALVGMIFLPTRGADGTPPGGLRPLTEEELFEAARHAGGLPGIFLSRLRGEYPAPSRPMVVHETSPRYVVEAPAAMLPPVVGGRVLGSALRAVPRAAALARAGRHGAAARVLTRGLRVLQGRDRRREAAECALQLGWLALHRGDPGGAAPHFAAARDLAGDSTRAVLGSVGLGVALTDEHRLLEAEAALRGALASAATLQDPEVQMAAAAALTRCLYWQRRWHDGIATAERQPAAAAEASRARLVAAHARCLARAGRTARAVTLAREAQSLAGTGDPATLASTELALAEVLRLAGDVEGARVSLTRTDRLARAAHLPLMRARALLLQPDPGARDPLRALRALTRVRLPPLLALRVREALATPGSGTALKLEPVAQLESLLDLSQKASDDDGALGRVSAEVLTRLGAAAVAVVSADERVLCLEGRPWPGVPRAVRQAFACGQAVPPERRREPQEAAEPVRFGGEVVAVLGCRWTAGAAIDLEGAAVLLRAAALSIAPHVRAILDRRVPEPPAAWADLLGESAAAVALREAVLRAARAPFPVLVEGESGCGKELVARAMHRLGPRRQRRFCALNCAALTDDLVEAELFGHTRGAFTGAATERAGLFEEADGGTLLLDEVGELSPRAQAKLLRVLQEGEVRRVGENMPRHVDVRVVAATNRNLADEVHAGRFRADLRFRLDVVRIAVPPLRERASDVPLLAAHFWRDAATRVGSQATLSPEALAALARYDWPGNVRELQNVIAWIAVQSARRGRIGPSALPRHVAQAAIGTPCTFEAAREEFERRFIRAALAGAGGQRARAAEAIGVSRQGLSKMMRRLRIS
jgi:DNA-binding NtrC family response regulator